VTITESIANDTFVDSGYTPSSTTPGTVDESSYGADSKIKATSSSFSNGFQTPSNTHVLFKLPQSFWTDLTNNPSYAEVDVTIYPFNNSLNLGGDGPDSGYRNLEMHPLTRAFTLGSGSMGAGDGTQTPTKLSDDGGPTWNSYDGNVNDKWTTPGGDFVDESSTSPGVDFVLAKDPTVNGVKTQTGSNPAEPFVWNIAPLLANPTLMADIENNGLEINVTNDYSPPPGTQDFTSMVSSDDIAPADAGFLPTVSILVPEPASLSAMLGAAVLLGSRRRRRC
jgi:hypothetical protein